MLALKPDPVIARLVPDRTALGIGAFGPTLLLIETTLSNVAVGMDIVAAAVTLELTYNSRSLTVKVDVSRIVFPLASYICRPCAIYRAKFPSFTRKTLEAS